MTMKHWTDSLKNIACKEGLQEGKDYPTFTGWWNATTNPLYLLWVLSRVGYPPIVFRLLAYRFIRETKLAENTTPDTLVWDLLSERSRHALNVAEHYWSGQADPAEFRKAQRALRYNLQRQQERCSRSARTIVAKAAVDVTLGDATQKECAGDAAVSLARAVGLNRLDTAPGPVVSRALSRPAEANALAQHADIIRKVIPVEEIEPLFERYILQLTNHHGN